MWINLSDVLQQMQAFGLLVSESQIALGRYVRVRHRDGGREKRGWFHLFSFPRKDGSGEMLCGSFGVWFGAENLSQKVELKKDDRNKLDKEEYEALKLRIKRDQKLRDEEEARRHERAATKATLAWRKCEASGTSAYLERKCVKSYGLRFSPSGNLVIPLLDTARKIHGLQVIYSDHQPKRPDKPFWPDGLRVKGHFFLIANPGQICLVCEGYATGASLHEATGLPVLVAFSANNLLPAAEAAAKKWRFCKFLFCADDDYLTEGNPGVTHATNAALAVGGEVVMPVFAVGRSEQKKHAQTDFNDLHVAEGLHVVAAQVIARLEKLKWSIQKNFMPPTLSGADKKTGSGARPMAMSLMDVDAIVERFAPVDDGTGDYVFDFWTHKLVRRTQMTALLPPGQRVDDIKRHPFWLSRGAFYLDQIGFDPSEKDADVKLNTWRGWPMRPNKTASCEMLLELLDYLCSHEQNSREVFDWLLCWMAYPLQHPGAKMASAVIMHGAQGTGKSTFFHALAKIYGDYAVILNQRGIEDKFNADWADSKLLIVAEEVVTRQEMWQIKNELKELVTGEWIRVNPKNISAYRQKNHINIVYLSNENQPLPLENDDRRHCVIRTPQERGEDFYDKVHQEIENGGVGALYDYLLTFDLSKFHPKKRPPMTDSKVKLIAISAPSEIRFVNDFLLGDLGLPVLPCIAGDFYEAYLKWCRKNGETRPRPSNQFHGSVSNLRDWEKRRTKVYPNEHSTQSVARYVVYPPAQAVEANGNGQTLGTNTAKWVSECCIKFRQSLEEHYKTALIA